MSFNSVQYALFLVGVVAIYWATPTRWRPHVLVAASLIFYGARTWWYDLLLLAAVAVAFTAGRALPRLPEERRRILMWAAVGGQLAMLAAFKLLGALTPGADGIGSGSALLPAGLSFYSFQAISYLIDVRRGTQEPEDDPVVFAAFVCFFPHLLAGPIVRARRLIPQIKDPRPALKRRQANEGLELILVGLFKKVAVADVLLGVNRDYQARLSAATAGTDPAVLIVVVMVLVIIGGYFDIAGYIDIARGSSKLLGIELPRHFAQPLTRSRNFTDFWRRWQTTLMGFLRDYLFVTVRGRSRTRRRISQSMTLVFLVVSLWHGLNVGFLLFGLSISGLLALERRVTQMKATRRAARPPRRPPSKARRALGRTGSVAWVWFCIMFCQVVLAGAGFTTSAGDWLRIARFDPSVLDLSLLATLGFAVSMLVLLDRYDLRQSRREGGPWSVPWPRAFALAAMAIGIVIASGSLGQDFVYTNF